MVKAEQAGKNGEKLANHRVRQSKFNLECLKSFKRQNLGWTVLIDSDEYLLTNNYIDNGTLSTTSVPELLREIHIPNVSSFSNSYSPCLPIHRIQYSAHESNITDVENQEVIPPGYHGNDFQTMRWRKFGFRETWVDTHWDTSCGAVRNIPNKVIIDLRRLKLSDLNKTSQTGNPHQPLDICPENIYSKISDTPFILHHYMGTPEQWFYRGGDKRGKMFFFKLGVMIDDGVGCDNDIHQNPPSDTQHTHSHIYPLKHTHTHTHSYTHDWLINNQVSDIEGPGMRIIIKELVHLKRIRPFDFGLTIS